MAIPDSFLMDTEPFYHSQELASLRYGGLDSLPLHDSRRYLHSKPHRVIEGESACDAICKGSRPATPLKLRTNATTDMKITAAVANLSKLFCGSRCHKCQPTYDNPAIGSMVNIINHIYLSYVYRLVSGCFISVKHTCFNVGFGCNYTLQFICLHYPVAYKKYV